MDAWLFEFRSFSIGFLGKFLTFLFLQTRQQENKIIPLILFRFRFSFVFLFLENPFKPILRNKYLPSLSLNGISLFLSKRKPGKFDS